MTIRLGKQAVVIGAGIAGLSAACILSDYFEQINLLERDRLPTGAEHRAGTPQDRHLHGLLVGGLTAFNDLFPGFQRDLAEAGAVPIRVSLDMRMERPGYDPLPQRDLGWSVYTMSRPLIDSVLRRYVGQRANISVRQGCRVTEIVPMPDAKGGREVRYVDPDGFDRLVPAEFVVDASATGAVTFALLRSLDCPLPEVTAIGIDRFYSTAIFRIPDDAPDDWKVVMTFSDPGKNSRRGILIPIEGNRWLLSTGDQDGSTPPRDLNGILAYLQTLRTPTIYDAVRSADPVGDVKRHAFKESVWNHFETLDAMPSGVLPIGDAICRFNPIHGQGMTVAAQEARLLRDCLSACVSSPDPLAALQQRFLRGVGALIQGPWTMSAINDFVFPRTRGVRPAGFDEACRFGAALERLAVRNPDVQKLLMEVTHLSKPSTAYRDPEIVRLVQAEMAALAA